VFDERYNNDLIGAAAIHPKILLKVILLAYAKGMISSRQIERACHENIIFIALSYGYAPDHSTIAAFVSSMQKTRSVPSSATYSWCVKNWNCWAARTFLSMG
jgi:transposase